MFLSELAPQLSQLSRLDKLQLINLLTSELINEEKNTLSTSDEILLHKLRNSHEAAETLNQLLKEDKHTQNNA